MSSDPRPVSPYGHLCFAFDDPAMFEARARAFLADGLRAGERIWYVAPSHPPATAEQVRFVEIGVAYPSGLVVDPQAQVAAYSAATREALAAGYTGLRVVADATPLVRTTAQLAAFSRYEHLIDRWMCSHPFTAMCAYDRGELGDATVAQLACLHAETNSELPFQLHASRSGDGSTVLSGELDLSTYDLLGSVLDVADPPATDGQVVLQAADLAFIDHRSLQRLDEYGCRRGVTVVLRSAGSAVGRLISLLELSRLRVEAC